jgi:hypothetical protein
MYGMQGTSEYLSRGRWARLVEKQIAQSSARVASCSHDEQMQGRFVWVRSGGNRKGVLLSISIPQIVRSLAGCEVTVFFFQMSGENATQWRKEWGRDVKARL